MLAQAIVRLGDAGIPLPPARAAQFLRRAAMAGKLATQHRAAGPREALGNEPKLGRRAAEAVNQQHTDAPALEELAAIGKLVLVILVVHVHQTFCVPCCLLRHAFPAIFSAAPATGPASVNLQHAVILLRKINSPLSPCSECSPRSV